MVMNIMALDQGASAWFTKEAILGGGIGIFRFCGFNSVFRFLCQKTSVFRFWHSLPLAEFPFFSIWFSVFVKNTNEFSKVEIDVVFGFS